MTNIGQKIKVVWNDARMFSPVNRTISISPMETIGVLEKEYDDFILIKNPITKNTKTGNKHPDREPTFYMIPKGMIEGIESL